MIRNILTKGLGAGAVASAAAPSTSQCRAQINHPAPTMKTGKVMQVVGRLRAAVVGFSYPLSEDDMACQCSGLLRANVFLLSSLDEVVGKKVTVVSLQMVEEWSLHDFENGFVMFEPAEIKEAVDDIMSLAPRYGQRSVNALRHHLSN